MQHPDPIRHPASPPLPERLLLRLADLPKRFTRPTWRNVLLLVAGAILAPGKRTVTAALRIQRILRREQANDFPIYHGVLNRAVWSSRAVAGWLLRLLVSTFLRSDATVVIGCVFQWNDWHRRHHRAALGAENPCARHLS